MTARATVGLTLDTGALLALDHPSKAVIMQARLDEARRRGGAICVPVGVVAQSWRGSRQVRLARLIKSPDVDIAIMTLSVARTVGSICAATGHTDVVDVHVALCARDRRHAVLTSDPDDIARIDPTLRLIRA
ncbi:MAG: PIN domain-containing protein [Solirubrobacteraceae bacterium]